MRPLFTHIQQKPAPFALGAGFEKLSAAELVDVGVQALLNDILGFLRAAKLMGNVRLVAVDELL